MKFDQIAYKVTPGNDFMRTMQIVQNLYGLDMDKWIIDDVKAEGFVWDFGQSINTARLAFNYPHGLEIEVIEYITGDNFHRHLDQHDIISHFGIHMDTDEEFEDHCCYMASEYTLVQKVKTVSHTNPYLLEQKRTYEYAIYDTRSHTGQFTKLIRRIDNS